MTTKPRAHRIGRLGLALASVMLAGSTALLTWRMTSLSGLPDIGDPFDVAAFGPPIPDDTNAFVLYRQAVSLLRSGPADLTKLWVSASPEERRWLEENRQALAVWKRGTARPEALHLAPGTLNLVTADLRLINGLHAFSCLACLEGSRFEADGDLDGALGWYVALLRSSRHCGKMSPTIQRLVGSAIGKAAMTRISDLIGRVKLDAGSLRSLLKALIEADDMTPPASESIKAEYLMVMNSLGDPAFDQSPELLQVLPTAWTTGPGKVAIRSARRLLHEPERSRRVYRLIVANWLAYCDRPGSTRPRLGPIGSPRNQGAPITGGTLLLYPVGLDAGDDLKLLTNQEIERWYESSLYLRYLLFWTGALHQVINTDRVAMANLIVDVATRLWKAERGADPTSASAPKEISRYGPATNRMNRLYKRMPRKAVRSCGKFLLITKRSPNASPRACPFQGIGGLILFEQLIEDPSLRRGEDIQDGPIEELDSAPLFGGRLGLDATQFLIRYLARVL